MEFLLFLILLGLGLIVGSLIEQRHYRQLAQREHQTRTLSVVNFGAKHEMPLAVESRLCVGSVVISSDYFKTVMASLMNLVGGNISVYETLLERGRREAMLRMKEEAIAWGATQIVNVRFETSSINGDAGNTAPIVELMAYGTGVRLEHSPLPPT